MALNLNIFWATEDHRSKSSDRARVARSFIQPVSPAAEERRSRPGDLRHNFAKLLPASGLKAYLLLRITFHLFVTSCIMNVQCIAAIKEM